MNEPLCLACNDTGWNPYGSWCQNCARGRRNYDNVGFRNPAMQGRLNAQPAAKDQHQMPVLHRPSACSRVLSGASAEKLTPAATARALKAALYASVVAITWAFVHFFSDGAMPSDDDVLDLEPDSPGPTPSDDYSTWEPEV